jgi:hypothetical protein
MEIRKRQMSGVIPTILRILTSVLIIFIIILLMMYKLKSLIPLYLLALYKARRVYAFTLISDILCIKD